MSAASAQKRLYPEVVWFRGVAALTVVAIHAISRVERHTADADLAAVLLPLMFATPVFVFISEYLFSRAYPGGLPPGFYRRRFSYLLLPYLCMALAYAVFEEWGSPALIARKAAENIFLGQFVGYFVLVIMQFYLLHHLLHRRLRRWNPYAVLGVAFAVNAAYLAVFNLLPPPPGEGAAYFWNRGFWLPAVGWLFYFALGYYAGRFRAEILATISRYRGITILAAGAGAGFLLLMLRGSVFAYVSSKRPDLLIYTPLIIALLALFSLLTAAPPRFLLLISNYSYPIYLLHWFTVDNLPLRPAAPITGVLTLMVVGLASSILLAKVLNWLPWGQYLVGRPYGHTIADYGGEGTRAGASDALGVPHGLGLREGEDALE